MKNILVTICARGGSKGVKDKNIRKICGKHLIEYTINTAKRWNSAKRIICSTDSKEIADIARANGIDVPFIRPQTLASDNAGKIGVIRHAFNECKRLYGEDYDIVVDLDVTNPLRTVEDLDNCLKIYNEDKPDVLFSVTESRKNPYFNMIEIRNGEVRTSKELDKSVLRRQDAPKVYMMNTSIYFYSKEFLSNIENTSVFSTKNISIYEMGELSRTDVDSELDLRYIEFLIKNKEVSI